MAGSSWPTSADVEAIDGEAETAVRDMPDRQGLPPREPTHVPALTANLAAASTGITISAPAVLVEAPAASSPERFKRARGRYVVAAAFGAVALLALGGIYLASSPVRSTRSLVLEATAPATVSTTLPSRSTAFASTHEGSGTVFLSVARPAVAVRVGVDAGVVGKWFWCIESSFGMPLADHYCATAGTVERGTNEFIAQAVLRVDPTWPSDALYFIQMYCEGACRWHVDGAPVLRAGAPRS